MKRHKKNGLKQNVSKRYASLIEEKYRLSLQQSKRNNINCISYINNYNANSSRRFY